jgi:FkbH-like protein
MYRTRAERQEQEARYTNLDEFLTSLEIEVGIEPATAFSIPRIAQLTQKTNQLNMTTRRYTEAQIQQFADDPHSVVLSVASKDRFGDDGIIGVIILAFAGETCRIDTLLLSCRVIGRGIEQLMVAFAADIARRRDARMLLGEFLPTQKNKPAAGVYEKMGFRRGEDSLLHLDLRDASVPYPPHIRLASESEAVGR